MLFRSGTVRFLMVNQGLQRRIDSQALGHNVEFLLQERDDEC